MKSCYYLPSLSQELNTSLKVYIDSIDVPQFIKQRADLVFSLKLSNAFSELKRFCYLRFADCIGLLIMFLLVLVSKPILLAVVLLFFFMQRDSILKTFTERHVVAVIAVRCLIPFSILVANQCLLQLDTLLGIAHLRMVPLGLEVSFAVRIGFFLGIPWYQLYAYRDELWYKHRGDSAKMWRDILAGIKRLARVVTVRRVVVSLGILLIASSVVWSGWILLQKIPPETRQYILIPFSLYLLYFYLKDPIKNYYLKIKDNKRTESFFRDQPIDRKAISEHFYKLRTEEGRLNFIVRLQNQRLAFSGEWTGQQIPNVGNDKASTLLAQLEEKWLGLDR